jgi:CheY-like chemotaxis protein
VAVRDARVTLFRDDGCDVLEASDGRDALAKALIRPASLVITETDLPFLDGFSLCELIRRDTITRMVPVLVVAKNATEANRAVAVGASAVVVAPTSVEVLHVEGQRLIAQAHQLRVRAESVAERLAKANQRSRELIAEQRTLTGQLGGFTTAPSQVPPNLHCPSCGRSLAYSHSHTGGVSVQREQWDYYACNACGKFQYRQRTRKLKSLG